MSIRVFMLELGSVLGFKNMEINNEFIVFSKFIV